MESSCDQTWRKDMKQALEQRFGLIVFDPNADAKQQWVQNLLKAREDRDYDTIERVAEGFVQKDLGVVDRQDFIIANLQYKVPTVGTVHEIVSAHSHTQKPVILFCEKGKEFIPFWYYGFINHRQFMFGLRTEVYDYLEQVDKGLINHRRWNLVCDRI